jgi:hypothetical protein
MPIEIQALDEVPENKLKKIIKDFAQDGANIITAINDGVGTFSVEATFIDPGPQASITKSGKMSMFGGPNDHYVSPSEGLAIFDDVGQAPPGLFLSAQPPGTTGLARRLDPNARYLACRWGYSVTPIAFLRHAIVKVSANGMPPVDAHPADWGPNIRTGRVADLSPGLAAALGLDTDDECKLEIPLPGGTAIPIPAAKPAVGVDLAAIDAMTFPSDMTRTLIVMTTSDRTTHWVTKLVGPNEGGQTLMRQVGNQAPELLRSDTVILPVKADAQISDVVAGELNKAVQKEPYVPVDPPGPAPSAGDDINAKMFATAKVFVGHSTRNVPGTDHGNLACAWAVNEVTRLALGKPISSDGGKNGLSTIGIFDALKARHTKLNSANDAKPGTIIIAPTQGSNHGHVGIVGTTTGTVNDTQVFSNKSNPGVFARNYTIQSFRSHYTGKGLQVLFFALNGVQF